MRVVFVGLGQEQLGVSSLSAVLRRSGHETALVFNPALFHDRYYFDVPVLRDVFDRDRRIVDEIVAAQPDLLAFSVLTPTYRWCLDIARRAKERAGMPVIFGGVHPSAVPEVCLENDQVDYVCVGEGEHALVSLCEQLERGVARPREPIPNLWWRGTDGEIVRGPNAAFIQDLDRLPFPDKELWEDAIDVGNHYLAMSSRGCPYRCTFCFNNFFAKLPGKGGGKYVRQRSVDNQMRELHYAKERFRLRYIEFTDDIFTVDKEWIREFTRRYAKEIGVPFQCLIHPRFIDREMAFWLRDAGCVHVQMGVQSADEQYKRSVLLRMERDNHLGNSLEALQAAGLPAKLDHILGLPGEPRSAQEVARELYVRYPPRRIQTFWLTYLPGIELTRQALQDGVLSEQDVAAIDRGHSRIFRHPYLQSDGGEAGDDQDFFQRYDILFRILPIVPQWVRRRARASWVPKMSDRAANLTGFAFDLLNSVARMDKETLVFMRHYAQQGLRQLPELVSGGRLGRRRIPIRRPVETDWTMAPAELPGTVTLKRRPAPAAS